jgi:hypothetical protein
MPRIRRIKESLTVFVDPHPGAKGYFLVSHDEEIPDDTEEVRGKQAAVQYARDNARFWANHSKTYGYRGVTVIVDGNEDYHCRIIKGKKVTCSRFRDRLYRARKG